MTITTFRNIMTKQLKKQGIPETSIMKNCHFGYTKKLYPYVGTGISRAGHKAFIFYDDTMPYVPYTLYIYDKKDNHIATYRTATAKEILDTMFSAIFEILNK